MSKAEKFIAEHTNDGSNELCSVEDINGKHIISYREWLMPEQALKAVEIEREELIEKALRFIKTHSRNDFTTYNSFGQPTFHKSRMIKAFITAMEE